MKSIDVKVKGVSELLMNNPQTVDPFNVYAREMKAITNKKKRTDDDIRELRRIEVEAKCYMDDGLGVYVPSSWVVAALGGSSWNIVKIKRADIRAAVFPTASKLKLHYSGMERVKKLSDISRSAEFQKLLLLKQGQKKVAKAAPVFRDWWFDFTLEFDDTVLNVRDVRTLLDRAAKYGGFGDFRPTYGTAVVEFGKVIG